MATNKDDSKRDGQLAVALASLSCELGNWRNSARLDTLAAAYAESGDYDSAVKWEKCALKFARPNAKLTYARALDMYEKLRNHRIEYTVRGR